MKIIKFIQFLAILVLLTGCSTFRSYNSEMEPVIQGVAKGDIGKAISEHESNASSDKDKDLLYFMEKGELQRLKKLYPETIATWTEADQMIAQWESEAKLSGAKVGEAIGSVVVNDKLRRYDGEDYEKVMLSTRLALAYLAAGKTEDALVEIKKTWERENLIKTLHEKEIDEAESSAKEKGYSNKSEDLKGYPISTLNSPEVTHLKNGYQNAFSHYLSGFLYEDAGETSLAAASYRTAIELEPSLSVLKDGLIGMDNRFSTLANTTVNTDQAISTEKKPKKKGKGKNKGAKKIVSEPVVAEAEVVSPLIPQSNESDVLFVVETGVAPYKKSIMIPLPIPSAGLVPISFPVLESNPISAIKATSITLPNNSISHLTTITSLENLSRRSLKDNLPWIMVRAAIRAAIKGGAQAAAYQQNAAAGLAMNAVNVATEQADERTWNLLPSEITIARVKLPEGKSTIKIQTSQGVKEVIVNVSGKHVVIPIRLIGDFICNLQAGL